VHAVAGSIITTSFLAVSCSSAVTSAYPICKKDCVGKFGSTCEYEYGEWTVWNSLSYTLLSSVQSRQEAELRCNEIGSKLTSLTTAAELAFVTTIQRSFTSWIGLVTYGSFSSSPKYWTDGSAYSYAAWKSGEPNDAGGVEDCAMNTPMGWMDVACVGTKAALPLCRKGTCSPQCVENQGYCTAINVCTCVPGFSGTTCDQAVVNLPGAATSAKRKYITVTIPSLDQYKDYKVILSVWSRESPVVSALEPTTGRIVTSSFDWTGLLPGFRYKVEVYPYFKIAGAYSVNPWVDSVVTTSCGCSDTQETTGAPINFVVFQELGFLYFKWTDASSCDDGYAFSRDGVAFVDEYSYSYTSDDGCYKNFSTAIIYDSIVDSKLVTGTSYSYCVRAISALGWEMAWIL